MNVLAYQPSMTKLWHACTCTSKAMTDEYCHHYIVDQPKRNIPKLATIFSFIQCILVLLNILLLISDHNYFINVKKKPGSYVNLATVSRFISNFLLYKFFFFFLNIQTVFIVFALDTIEKSEMKQESRFILLSCFLESF